MLKKSFQVEGFDGEQTVKDCYFNLTAAELLEMEVEFDGGLAEHLSRIGNSKDNVKILNAMKWLVGKAYGVRVGNEFVKTPEQSRQFASTEAYSELLLELVAGGEKAMVEFVEGIMPKKLRGQKINTAPAALNISEQRLAQAIAGDQELPEPKLPRSVTISPLGTKKFHEYTREELMRLPAEEYDRLLNEINR